MKTPNRIKSFGKLGVAFVFLLFQMSLAHGEATKQPESPQQNQTNANALQFDTYKNEKFKFQISYPKDWHTATSVNNAVWKIDKTTTNETGSISISVAKYTGNDPVYLNKMLDQEEGMLQELKRRFTDGKILDKGKTFLGSFPAVYFKSSYTVKNYGTNTVIILIQIMCIRDDRLYVVSFETMEGSHQKTQSQFQAIISTFTFNSTESATAQAGIKAFDDLFFGEEKAIVERKQKKQVRVGESLFELSCGYEKIEGKELLSQVNLLATWTDVPETIVYQNLDEFKKILSTKFGKTSWHIRSYEGRIGEYELNKSGSMPSTWDGLQRELAKYANDQRFVLQYQWKLNEERIVNVWMRDRIRHTERKEKIEVQSANWFREAKFEEVSRFDKYRELNVWIEIKSPAVEKMKEMEANLKAKEAANPF